MERILTPTNYELIPLNDLTNVRFYTSVDTGSYIASHWHDAVEIIYILEGDLLVTVEQSSFRILAGQCVMITPNQVHSTLCTRPNRAIVFQIPVAFLEKFIPDAKQMQFTFHDPAETRIMQTKVKQFKNILLKMQVLVDSGADGAVLRFNSLLFEVLFQLYHNFGSFSASKTTARRNRDLEKLFPVLNYIKENYNRPIPLSEIADVAMLQSKYFCRFFKKCMGVTFLEYQNEIRLSRIYDDIINTDDQISLILERHGFTNYKLFRRMFRERFECTPTELRGKKN